jgi:nucleoside 2-deoxyribosyltransferase
MHDWREKLEKDYGTQCEFIDPTGHIMQDEDDPTAIVEMDKEAIRSCDFVLAHTWKISSGTSMEILYAFNETIPVYVVSDKRESGWVHYHSESVHETFVDAMAQIFDAFNWSPALDEEEEEFEDLIESDDQWEVDAPDFALDHLSDDVPDMVNHPSHYTAGGIETKDFIRAKGLNYNLGNAVKYITRSGKKPTACPIEDLRKAVFYLNDEIEHMEN